jgi:uncharacterized lipoprotein YddW (UPF0748 family)
MRMLGKGQRWCWNKPCWNKPRWNKPRWNKPRWNKPRWNKWRRYTLIALLTWFGVISLWQAPIVRSRIPTNELRAVWMTHYGLALSYQTTRLDDAVADLAKQGINTLYPAVWNQGHTLYPSQVLKQAGNPHPRNPWLYLPGLPQPDILAALIKQSQRQGLNVIPWLEYGLMVPIDAAIVRQHPDWLTQRQDRGQSDEPLPGNHPLGQIRRTVIGGQQAWLNPFHPEVRRFLIDLATEVVQQYDVDGIQLDDHFGLPTNYGYDPVTIAQYRKTHAGKAPPTNERDPEWVKWRADRLTELMREINQSVKRLKPQATIVLSPNLPDYAYRHTLQDWARWVELGLVDQVILQVYRPEIRAFQSILDQPQLNALRQQVPLSIGLYTGPMKQPKPIAQVQQEIQAVRDRNYTGFGLFCWETSFWQRGKRLDLG